MSASKNFLAELNKNLRLNEDNYKIWSKRVQMILSEQKLQEHIIRNAFKPNASLTVQQRVASQDDWESNDRVAYSTIMSTVDDDILCEFEKTKSAKELWDALKERFGVNNSTALMRALRIKFDSFKYDPSLSMKVHLRHMANMITELKEAGQVLTDEQQIQAVIRSLPSSWEHMQIHLTHSQDIKTFEHVRRQLEMEEDRLKAITSKSEVHMASFYAPKNSRQRGGNAQRPIANALVAKRARTETNVRVPPPPPPRDEERKRRTRERKLESRKCFNCGQKGHFKNVCPVPIRQD